MLGKLLSGFVAVLVLTAACVADDMGAASADGTDTMTPIERVNGTEKGQLKNPYSDDDAKIVEEGKKLFMSASCNGCHGGSGGGGMCPPLSNDTWVYGGDDDTIFRLVALGSVDLQKAGYSRVGRENVAAPMIPQGTIVKTDDDLWKIITFIRSNYRGSPDRKYGKPPAK